MKLPTPIKFLAEQPLHKSLRQLRIPTMVILGVSVDILYRLVELLDSAQLSGDQATASIVTLAGVVIAAIWKGINSLAESHKEDS